jgi:hypothetical protein
MTFSGFRFRAEISKKKRKKSSGAPSLVVRHS